MRATSRGLALVLSAAVLAGCEGPQPTPLSPPPVEASRRPTLAIAPLVDLHEASAARPVWHAGLPREALPLGYALVCVKCEEPADLTGVTLPACADCTGDAFHVAFSRPFRPRVDLEAARARAVALLGERGLFEATTLLPAPEEPLVAAPRSEARDAWKAAAKEAGARFLLEPTLDDARVELVDKNGWHAFKIVDLIVCSLLIFPAIDPPNWFIPGEDYGLLQRLTWRLTDLESSAETRGEREARTVASFADLGPAPSRGFFFVGFLRVPNCLDEEDWADISAQLEEVGAEDLARALAALAEEATATPPAPR